VLAGAAVGIAFAVLALTPAEFDVAQFCFWGLLGYTNAGPTVATVDDYAVNVRVKGQWHRLHPLHIINPADLYLVDPKKGLASSYPVTFTPGLFDGLVRNTVIQPGDGVKGLMFFQWPGALRKDSVPTIEQFLFEVEDTLGRTQRTVALDPSPGGTSIRDSSFITGDKLDLSGVPVRLPSL
jgi:hypothetical protein